MPRRWLVCAFLCSTTLAVSVRAQQAPQRWRSDADARAPSGHSQVLADDFSDPARSQRNWIEHLQPGRLRGETPDAPAITAATVAPADDGDDEQGGSLTLRPLNLAGMPGAEVAFSVRPEGIGAGESLAVEYRANHDRWALLERVVADGRDRASFSMRFRVLPDDALHSRFQLRFRASSDLVDGAWYVGDVAIAVYTPMLNLHVRTQPVDACMIEIVRGLDEMAESGLTPVDYSAAAGTRLHVVAPANAGGLVFSHWTVNGQIRVERQRVLTLDLADETTAIAQFAPPTEAREATVYSVDVEPAADVRIACGPDIDRLCMWVETSAVIASHTGEWLTLFAPPRPEDRLAFERWVVNGRRQMHGESVLMHAIEGQDVLVAEYVLLGDMNGDDVLDKADVDLFAFALSDPAAYGEKYPDLDCLQRGDVNGDGVLDGEDVEGFVDLMLDE